MSEINVPQIQPQAPQAVNPFPIADAYLNRQQQGWQNLQQSIQGIGSTYQQLRQQKIAQQLEALKSISELYGQGGPGAVQMYAPTINRVAGTDIIQQGQGAPPQQMQPPYSQGRQLAPDPNAGMPKQGGVSEHIKNSVGMGHPDFTGHIARIQQLQNQMAGFQNQGKYGQNQTAQLSQNIAAEKAAMDAEVIPQTYEKQQQEIELGKRKPVADEASKRGEDITRTGQLRGLFNDMKSAVSQNKPSAMAGFTGKVANMTGGRVGNTSAANMLNVSAPLTAALNYELTKRFNEGEASFLMDSLMPKPNDTPQFAQQKVQRLDRMISAIESGNEQNIKNMASVISGGKASTKTAQPLQTASLPQGRITVKSPTGQVGHIPASQLKAALAEGYTQQ